MSRQCHQLRLLPVASIWGPSALHSPRAQRVPGMAATGKGWRIRLCLVDTRLAFTSREAAEAVLGHPARPPIPLAAAGPHVDY